MPPRQPASTTARPAPREASQAASSANTGQAADSGSSEHWQPAHGQAAEGQGQNDGHAEPIRSRRLRPKALNLIKNVYGGKGRGVSCGADCSHGQDDQELRSPGLTPGRLGPNAAQATPSHDGGVEADPRNTSVDAVDSSVMQLNSNCEYPGHCVQLRNTFIHVECTADEEEDCVLCGIERRQRARSADDLHRHAAAASPDGSPAIRPQPDPSSADSAADTSAPVPAPALAPTPKRVGPARERRGRADSSPGGAARQWQWQ